MEINKLQLAKQIIECQTAYSDLENELQYKSEIKPFGNVIAQFNYEAIAELISAKYDKDNCVVHWTVRLGNKTYSGDLDVKFYTESVKSADIHELYFSTLEDELESLCFKQHLIKNILTRK